VREAFERMEASMEELRSAGSAQRLARIQAVSGLLFSLFLLIHLTNTGLALRGGAAYDAFQRMFRPIYQHPLIELGVIALPLIVHVWAGVQRMRARKGQVARANLRTRLHRYSAYYLLVFIVGHVLATRGPSLMRGVYPEFGGVAWAFQVAPYWFFPYYTLLALAGLYHSVHGAHIALGVLGVRSPRLLRKGAGFWLPVGSAALLLFLAVLSFGGFMYAVPDESAHPFAQLGSSVLAQLGL
jgi:succinate dehydrogenase / fumarate reductase cytochrome b subunit